jgi:hypothetical protein
MNHIRTLIFLFLLLPSAIVSAQFSQANSNTILVGGEPSLTQGMIIKLAAIYKTILQVKFTTQQQERLQKGIVNYWVTKNEEAIKQCLDNLKYYGQQDELESLRNSSQSAIVESLRRDVIETHDEVSIVLIEAFDEAHPDLSQQTSAKTFGDVVGTWKQSDYLLQQKNAWDNNTTGVGYTNTEILSINPDYTFKLIKVHDHYSNGCDQQTASMQTGTITVKGINLVLKIEKGSSETNDNCNPQFNQHKVMEPHTENFVWSIRSNPEDEKIIMLCLNAQKDSAVCYEKQ